MYIKNKYNFWIIWSSFIVGGILQIIPYPSQYIHIPKPSWLSLLLIYWITKIPEHINIGTSFIIGVITDITLGTTLGIYALSLSILSYLLIIKFPLFYIAPFWKQELIVILFSLFNHIIISILLYLSVKNIICFSKIFLHSIIDGIIWPGILLLMNKIRY